MKKRMAAIALMLGLCLPLPLLTVCASENTEMLSEERAASFGAQTAQAEDIVVLLDCSKSMESVDETYMAFDFIAGLASALPSHYRLGVAGYNEEIIFSVPPGNGAEAVKEALAGAEEEGYARYGNAGLGLETAVGLFDDRQSRKRILILSDGENLMKTREATEDSAVRFEKAVSMAREKGITVDVVNLGEKIEDAENIYSAPEQTDGAFFLLKNGGSLQEFLEECLFTHLGIAGRLVGRIDGREGEIRVTLPDSMMENARIILTGVQDNDNLTVNGEAERLTVCKGKSYTVVELLHPASAEISVRMSGEEAIQVSAYLTAEYQVSVQADYAYDAEREAADFTLAVQNGQGASLLEGHLTEKNINLLADGNPREPQIREGKLFWTEQVSENKTINIEINLTDDFASYYGSFTAQAAVEAPVIPEEEETPQPDYFFY